MGPTGEGLDEPSRALVARYWWQRAEGELTSWVAFRQVLEDLRREGSPAPVLALAERAVADEHRHAGWCRDWAIRFGHDDRTPLRPRSEEPLRFRGATEDENRLLRIAFACLTETVGCFVLRAARPHLRDAELRQQSLRHTKDELQHSRVGWAHLATLDATRRAWLVGWMPRLLKLLPVACCDGSEEARDDLVAFGYFSRELLCRAHDEAVREVILPGLSHLGLARAA
jgi:uncharacterized protein (DUF1778 family)